MRRRWWKRLLIVTVTLPLLAWGCDRLQTIHWVGSTDLDVEFAVTDEATGGPVSGARVEVQSEGGFYEERERQEFVLVAGVDGVARKECRRSMCFGTRSGLGFTSSFAVHLPWWRYRVVTEGYAPTGWYDMDVLGNRLQVQRSGTDRAKLVVPVPLHKSHAGPAATADTGHEA